jgi:hypothetical protein
MKKLYFWIAALLFSVTNFAQITLNSTTGSTGYTGSNSCGSGAAGNCYITFAVQNTSSSPIQITEVGQWTTTSNNANTVDLYSSTTSLSGTISGPFSATSPPTGWTLAASGTISGITTAGVNPVLTGLNIVVPAGATLRFAILPSGTVSYSGTGVGTASPNTFSNSGINLLVGDAQIGGGFVGFGGVNNPRFFTGSVSFVPLAPCVGAPTGGTTNSTSTAVCPLQNFTLTLAGASLASGISYQWESSSTGTGSWTPITGATVSNLTTSQTVDTYYRCALTCSNSGQTAYSTTQQITTLPNLAGGTYTIGSGGTYANFTAAFNAASCGVSGPVVFQVLPNSGPYNEQLTINEIPGMSATNTITVKGNFNTLTNSVTTGGYHTLFLNGADYLKFEDLTIEAAGTTQGWGVRMNNNADYNTFKRCIIKTSESSTSSAFAAFTLTTSATAATGTQTGTASNLMIDSCQIIGGYYGLCLNGSGLNLAAGRPSNNTVRNSTIANFYLYGIYAYGQNDLKIENNDINRISRATVSTCYGMYNYGRNPGFRFTGNRVHDLGGTAGVANFTGYLIYGSSLTGTASNRVLIANNAIYNVNNGTSTVYGMYMLSTDTADFYHNTLDLNSSTATTTGTVYGAYFSGNLNSVNFKNNLISIASPGTGAKYCLYNASTTALINSNNNGFHLNNPGGTLNFVGARSATARYTTVTDWTAATGADANSLGSNPLYINIATGDVTPGAFAYNNSGAPVFSSVPTDINGAARSATTPDIGAVEFTPTGCPAPFAVSVSNVRANSAQVTFSSLSSSVDLQWGPKGFTPGTGQGQTITTTTYTMTGLTSYTAYDLYLAGNCGPGQTSVWVGPYSFVTPVQVGWVEPFSGGYDPLATTPKPMLWSELNGPAANPTVIASNTSAWMEGGWLNSGTTGAIENAVPVTSSATQGWTVTPTIDLGDVAHTTYFEWDMGVTNGGTAAGVMGLDDSVMVVISTNNGVTWNRSSALKKYHRMSGLSPFGGRYSLNLSSYTGLVKIGFYVESLTSSAAHPFATSFDVHVDNVALVATQSPCLVPDVTIATTATSATVSWTPAATGGQIAWGPVGFSIGSGASGANQAAASTNPYTITGLTPGTGYQVYYQTPCGATAGQWVGPFTFSTPCLSAMNGAYTVDISGTGANNFTTLAAAVNALSVCGISGPVTLTLAGYEHTGGLNLALIPGTSATNTVTFQGAAAGGSVIKGTVGQFGAVVFNGTKHVTIQNLTVNAPTMSGVILTGGAEYITIHNNSILSDTTGTSSTVAAIASTANLTSVTAYGNNADHITITNNLVKGGYYGIRFNGTSTTIRNSDINISGNTVSKVYYYGIYTYYIDDLKLNDNVVDNFRNTFNYAIYAYYVNGAQVQRNVTNSYYYGLTLGYLNNAAKPSVNSLVANNMFNATNSYGAYFPYPRYLNMYNNTMKGSSYGCYMLTSTTTLQAKVLDMRNNIFQGGTYAFYFSGTTMDSVTMDYNVYNHGGTTFVWYGAARANLAAWQTANPTLNANSSTNPVIFAGLDDLHVVNGGPNNLGTPIAGITVDVDGDVRSATTPDIGADEYTPIDFDMSLEMIQGIAGCGDSNAYATVVVKNRGNVAATAYTATVELNGPNGTVSQQTALTGVSLPSFGSDTLQVGPFNTYAGGAFAVQGWVTYANDQVASNDSVNGGVRSTTSIIPATVAQTGVCFNADSVTFVANAVPGVRYAWYPTATDTVAIVDGDSLTVALDPNATYYLGYRSSIDTIVQNAGALTATGTNITPYKTFYHDGRAQYIIYADELQTALGGPNPSLISGIAFDVVTAAAQGMNDFTVKAGNIPTIPSTGYIDNTGFTTVFNTATYNTVAGWNLHSFSTPVLWDGVSDFCVEVCFNNTSFTSNSSVRYETLTRKGTIDGFADAGVASGCTPGVVGATHANDRPNFKLIAEAQACSNLRLPVTALIDSTAATAVATFAEVNPANGTFEFYANNSTGTSFTWTYGDGNSGSGDTATHSYGGPGVFTVTLVVTDSTCNTADTTTFTVTSHIGLDENALGQTLAAFPNPNSGQFTVRIAGSAAFEGQLEVLNLMGQVVSATSVDKRSATLDVNLDLSNYAKGIYMVRLSGAEGQAVLRVVVR